MNLLKISPLLLVAACASTPTGPGVMVLPGSGKSFDQFRFDDYECRQYAQAQVGGTPNQAAADSGVASRGAGVGAGVGLATGAVAGTGAAQASGRTAQQRYDIGYQQCMYAKGHKIPMASGIHRGTSYRQVAPPPPPPSGTPPPPPPPRG